MLYNSKLYHNVNDQYVNVSFSICLTVISVLNVSLLYDIK